jgi:hypothetical protein
MLEFLLSERDTILVFLLPINTIYYLSVRYHLISVLNLFAIPENSNLDNEILRFTQSKDFSKSLNMPPTVNLLFMVNNIHYLLIRRISAAELLRNPHCSFASTLIQFMY